MNTKKILLSTLAATTLGLGMAMPFSLAAKIDGTKLTGTVQSNYVQGTNTITVMPKAGLNPSFEKTEFTSLLDNKFGANTNKTINYSEASKEGKYAGTGTTVTIGDKTYTLLLLGDIDGNGRVLAKDARNISGMTIRPDLYPALTGIYEKVGNLRYFASDKDKTAINMGDARIILRMSLNSLTEKEYSYINFPSDESLDAKLEDAMEDVNSAQDFVEFAIDPETNKIEVEVNAAKLAEEELTLADLAKDDNPLKEQLKSIRDTLKETASSNKIQVSYGDGEEHTIDITDTSIEGLKKNEELKSLIKEILGDEYKGQTADQLIATPLYQLYSAVSEDLHIKVQSDALLDENTSLIEYLISIN